LDCFPAWIRGPCRIVALVQNCIVLLVGAIILLGGRKKANLFFPFPQPVCGIDWVVRVSTSRPLRSLSLSLVHGNLRPSNLDPVNSKALETQSPSAGLPSFCMPQFTRQRPCGARRGFRGKTQQQGRECLMPQLRIPATPSCSRE
jgi:hypothetical protein